MPSVLAQPNEKYWISYIKQRIKKNKNFLGFISGQTGSGKSYSSLRICSELDENFTIDRVVFNGVELMKIINSGTLKKGSAICFEELGVEMNAKNWFSITNKMLNFLMQTFRHRNFILLMNSPYLDFIDSSTRKLFHAEMRTVGIDFKDKQVKLKPQLIQYNSRNQKFYYKRLKVIVPQGKVPVDIWKIDMPEKELRIAYENKKKEYTDKLNKKIQLELEQAQNKGEKKTVLTQIQKDTLEMLRNGMLPFEIAEKRDRSKSLVEQTIRGIRNKGYTITPRYVKGNPPKVVEYIVKDPST